MYRCRMGVFAYIDAAGIICPDRVVYRKVIR